MQESWTIKDLFIESQQLAAVELHRLFTMRKRTGRLVSIRGPMFAGKSTILRSIMKAWHKAWKWTYSEKQEMLAVRPYKDNRDDREEIVTHTGLSFGCQRVNNRLEDILTLLQERLDVGLLMIDELQMFHPDSVLTFVTEIEEHYPHLMVVGAGLDLTFDRKEWLTTSRFASLAHREFKLFGTCIEEGCEEPSRYSRRIVASKLTHMPGGADIYQPCCPAHFRLPPDA